LRKRVLTLFLFTLNIMLLPTSIVLFAKFANSVNKRSRNLHRVFAVPRLAVHADDLAIDGLGRFSQK